MDNMQSIKVDMRRGWPCKEQLELSNPMLNIIDDSESLEYEVDYRNYAGTGGIIPAKKLFADLMDVNEQYVHVGSIRSIFMMFNIIGRAVQIGFPEYAPWQSEKSIKFICPVPGYDTHFWICDSYNIEMIPVDMLEDGPDMDKIEELVKNDSGIKGIWCVPKYSNPTGTIYSYEVCRRLAKMKTAAGDFKVFWDNAYCVHDLTDVSYVIPNMYDLCKECGNEDRVFIFGSTSKITFPGAGLSFCICSEVNQQWIRKSGIMQLQVADKINQLRHVKFLKDVQGINNHMKKHRDIIAPKFLLVDEMLKNLLPDGICKWKKPLGGYFICLELEDARAMKVWEYCHKQGIEFTKAGASFPHMRDPHDKILRIAPTYPSIGELEVAIEMLCKAIIYA